MLKEEYNKTFKQRLSKSLKNFSLNSFLFHNHKEECIEIPYNQ